MKEFARLPVRSKDGRYGFLSFLRTKGVLAYDEPMGLWDGKELRQVRVIWWRLLWVFVALGSVNFAFAKDPTVPPVSVIQIPLELDLAPLFRSAESSLPTQTGHWPQWRDWRGIGTRYRAWRGPLSLAMQADILQAQAHVRYQLQARKRLIGDLGLSAGCGLDEPPRQALISALARLTWAPDWTLHPQFRVLPTRFLDRCEVTVADIDVSPLVGKVFEERIETALKKAMRSLAPRLTRLRGEATRAWQSIQAPREVKPGLWLHIQPLGLALAPPQGVGSQVQTAVWLAFRARLSGGDAGSGFSPTPLPPLVPYQPSQPGLRLALELELDYQTVAATLSERLADRAIDIRGKKAELNAIGLSTKGEDLVLSAELSGDLSGQLTVMARLGFDTAAQTLRLEDVDFVFDSVDPDQELIANLFYERIRTRIETAANSLLAERTQGLHNALMAPLASGLPPNLVPDLSELRIAELHFRVGDSGLHVQGTANGTLKLGRSHAPGRL